MREAPEVKAILEGGAKEMISKLENLRGQIESDTVLCAADRAKLTDYVQRRTMEVQSELSKLAGQHFMVSETNR